MVALHHEPFILRPERRSPEPWLGVLRDLGVRRGDPQWVEAFVPSMRARARALGTDIDFGGEVGNSLASHRLLHWAGEQGLQDALASELAECQFRRRRCVGRREVLLEAARSVGLPAGEAAAVLEDEGRGRDAVLRSMQACPYSSIPVLTLRGPGGTAVLQGAREVDEYRAELRRCA